MLNLPKSTVFGKRIPKQKFYDNLSVTAQLKQVFVGQISQIIWLNKIAPDTLNIAVGDTVAEIEVISIRLNQRELDKRVLPLIDKEIPYHILSLLEHDGKTQAWIGYKEQSKSSNAAFKPGTYYHTDWLAPDSLDLQIDGLNMDKVYENLIRQIAGERLGGEDNIKDAVVNAERKQKLEKEIAALEKKVLREKQFNRQVELNDELKRLRAELVGLG